MFSNPWSAERKLMVVVGCFVVGAVLPALFVASASGWTESPWSAFDLLWLLIAAGLARRWRPALLVARIILAYEMFMLLLMAVNLVLVREGTLYAGFPGTWLYTQSPYTALPLGVIVAGLTYWQWRALGSVEVQALFRRLHAARTA